MNKERKAKLRLENGVTYDVGDIVEWDHSYLTLAHFKARNAEASIGKHYEILEILNHGQSGVVFKPIEGDLVPFCNPINPQCFKLNKFKSAVYKAAHKNGRP